MPTRRAVVMGHVQGVGFRAFVRRLAASMGVQGEVWNRHDGAVELYAAHEDEAVLNAFESRLQEGPGHVQGVEFAELPDGFEAQGFRIGATRP